MFFEVILYLIGMICAVLLTKLPILKVALVGRLLIIFCDTFVTQDILIVDSGTNLSDHRPLVGRFRLGGLRSEPVSRCMADFDAVTSSF